MLWLFTVLEAGASVVKALADLVSGGSLLPGSQVAPCHTGKDGGLSGVSVAGHRVCPGGHCSRGLISHGAVYVSACLC